jgi:uncharacterized membrane protein YfcA
MVRTMIDSTFLLVLTVGVLLLAGFVKGVIGGGLPTISIGILSFVMPIPQAAALMILPSLVTNVWQTFGPHFGVLLRRLWPMLVGICVGCWLGAGLMTGAYGSWTRIGLGAALMLYAVTGLVKLRLHVPRSREWWLAPIIGVTTGFIAAGTGVFVIPAAPYLQAIGLQKDDLVQALGVTYTLSTFALTAIVAQAGFLRMDVLAPSCIALAAALVGMTIGQKVRARLSERTFRTCFYIGLLGIGASLALHELL